MNYQRYFGRGGSCEICKTIKLKRTFNSRVYRFPIEPDRCRLWVKSVGIESLAYLSHQNLNNHKFLCGIHFSPLSFNEKRGLHKMAFPTENMPYEPLSDKILKGFPVKKITRSKGSHTKNSSTSTNMNEGTSLDADIPIKNCMDSVTTGEPKDTLNDKETANMATSNVEYVKEVQQKTVIAVQVEEVKEDQKITDIAVPPSLKKCTKIKDSSGGKIRVLPQTLISKSKRYGKCYSRANKIIKQNNTTELTNDKSISQLPSAEATNIINVPIMDKEPAKDMHDVPLKADELHDPNKTDEFPHPNKTDEFPDPNKTDELSDPNKTDELPDPNDKYEGILPVVTPRPGTTYDTPLLNCTETIFKYGKIHYGSVTSGDYEVITIDVPLMRCMKTIEDII